MKIPTFVIHGGSAKCREIVYQDVEKTSSHTPYHTAVGCLAGTTNGGALKTGKG
jgi:hypothetical protein